MAREPVLSGEIPHDGVIDVLREIEQKRITGKIRYLIGDESGEVDLAAGQITLDQDPLPSGADPVEALLAARSGMYAVHALLPALAISQGDEHERRGSLAVHVPADLMTYCEQAGLTGSLEMRNSGRLVEVVYEFGELLAIRIDGREQTDLADVFAWDEGSFRIALRTPSDVRSRLPEAMSQAVVEDDPDDREPTVRFAKAQDGAATGRFAKSKGTREDTGAQLLRMVEVALTDVVSTREKARASLRSTPPKAAHPSVAPPRREASTRRDATVRVVWMGGEPEVAGDLGPPKPEDAKLKVDDAKLKVDDAKLKVDDTEHNVIAASGPREDKPAPRAETVKAAEALRSPQPDGTPSWDPRWIALLVFIAFVALIAHHFLGSSH